MNPNFDLSKLEFPKYFDNVEISPVDIDKLRPNKSYECLYRNRDYQLRALLAQNDGILPAHLLEFVKCGICNSSNSDLVMTKDGFQIRKCSSCFFIFVNPRLSKEVYVQTYNSENYGHIIDTLALASHDYRKSRFGSERIEFIESYHNSSLEKTLLDIGSASGFFIERAREKGWNSIGLELTDSAVQFSREKGNKVLQCTLEQANFSESSFSVITLFDVLEHLSDPLGTLRDIYKLLIPGGLIYIYVPNWNSATRLLLGESAHFIWPTHHLSYFTPKTLAMAVDICGFTIEHIETQGLDIVDWLWQVENIENESTAGISSKINILQFLVNSAGYGKNLRLLARKPWL